MLLATAVTVSGLIWVIYAKDRLIDDAYIYLSYARTLSQHGQWGMVDSLPSNTATSSLWVLVLAAGAWLFGNAVLASGVAFVACNAFLAWGLRYIAQAAGLPPWIPWFGWGLLLVNPLLISSAGMESLLALTLLVWLVVCAQRRRGVWLGLLLAALFMTRPELLLVGLVMAVIIGTPLKRLFVSVAVCTLALTPWLAVSWLFLGSVFPDTLLIKRQQGSWGEWDFGNGLLLYFDRFPVPTTLALLSAGMGALAWLLVLFRRGDQGREIPVALGAGGVLYFVAYALLGVPPYHWYYAVPIGLLSLTLVLVLGSMSERVQPWPLAFVLTATCAPALVLMGVLHSQQEVPIAALTTNWAAPGEYETMAMAVREQLGDGRIRSPGETGTLSYFCNCPVLDSFSDRGVAADLVGTEIRRSNGLHRSLLELNYRHRDLAVQPLPTDFTMTWVAGAAPGSPFDAYSPWTGPGHFVVEPVPGA
jgi:hypothetical protein